MKSGTTSGACLISEIAGKHSQVSDPDDLRTEYRLQKAARLNVLGLSNELGHLKVGSRMRRTNRKAVLHL